MAEAAFAEASSGASLDNPFMTAIDQQLPAALGRRLISDRFNCAYIPSVQLSTEDARWKVWGYRKRQPETRKPARGGLLEVIHRLL